MTRRDHSGPTAPGCSISGGFDGVNIEPGRYNVMFAPGGVSVFPVSPCPVLSIGTLWGDWRGVEDEVHAAGHRPVRRGMWRASLYPDGALVVKTLGVDDLPVSPKGFGS